MIPITLIAICFSAVWIFNIKYKIYKKGYIYPEEFDKSNCKKIKNIFKNINLNKELIHNIWPHNSKPPIFVRGKDYFDITSMENKKNSKYKTLRQLESYKSASMSDLKSLSRLAVLISKKSNNIIDDDFPLGMIDVDVLDEKNKKIVDGRSLIAAGGGDTNALTVWIYREFERLHNILAPLRFNARQTSESIIAETWDKFYIYPETSEIGKNKGLFFIMKYEKNNNHFAYLKNRLFNFLNYTQNKHVFIVLAGNHQQGTLATINLLGHILNSEVDIITFKYYDNIIIPNILVDSKKNNNNILLNNITNEADIIITEIEIDNKTADVLVILGHDKRDLEKEKNWLTGRESCRIIDFLIKYKEKNVEIIGDFDSKPDISLYNEIITVGTIHQNKFLEKLYKKDVEFKERYDNIIEKINGNSENFKNNCGALIVYKLVKETNTTNVAALFGNLNFEMENCNDVERINALYRSTQSAIIGLIQKTLDDRLIRRLPESDYIFYPDEYYDSGSKYYIKNVKILYENLKK